MRTDEFIKKVRSNAQIPDNQTTFTDEVLLDYANLEISLSAIPVMVQSNRTFFVTSKYIDIKSNENRYTIPYRSVGEALRELAFVDENNNLFNLEQVDIANLYAFQYYDSTQTQYSGDPERFYIENNDIVIYPVPSSGDAGQLKMSYYLRPSELVAPSQAAQVDEVNGNRVIFLSKPDSLLNTVDIISKQGNQSKLVSESVSIEFDDQLAHFYIDLKDASDIEAGDWICNEDQSPVVQLPHEVIAYLVTCVTIRYYASQGDQAKESSENRRMKKQEENLMKILGPRVAGELTPIFSSESISESGE